MKTDFISVPDSTGHYGKFGGRFVPETLFSALADLESAYAAARTDNAFQAELAKLLHEYVGRPTPLYFAERLTKHFGKAKIYLKREDLCHTGAHKINNTVGQILLAKKLGKKRIIAETGAGQHGVATATVASMMGLSCQVYMGTEDMARQEINVDRMRLLGAEVMPSNPARVRLRMRPTKLYVIGSPMCAIPFTLSVPSSAPTPTQ